MSFLIVDDNALLRSVSKQHSSTTKHQWTRLTQARRLHNSDRYIINTLPYVLFPQRQCFLLGKLFVFHFGEAPHLTLSRAGPTLTWAESLLRLQLIGSMYLWTHAHRAPTVSRLFIGSSQGLSLKALLSGRSLVVVTRQLPWELT